jgi:hypothetical protein
MFKVLQILNFFLKKKKKLLQEEWHYDLQSGGGKLVYSKENVNYLQWKSPGIQDICLC